jgi:hypothetical protein
LSRPLSVVVASFREPELLEACLESLSRARERIPEPVPVFVARAGSGEEVRHLFVDRSWATLVPVDVGADVPRLRGEGMTAAGDGWVAVTEDHCVVDADWLEVVAGNTGGPFEVVGGGMGNARAGALNWGAYFSEYGFFSSGRPRGEGLSLVTGANALYGSEVSGRVTAWASEGAWEDVIHRRLAAQGVRFLFAPDARVRQNAKYDLASFCRDRFEHGHDYACVRLSENPGTSRAMRLATVPLLPFVLTWRVGRAAARESPGAFLTALPFTFVFLGAWSVGEAVGYWKGKTE